MCFNWRGGQLLFCFGHHPFSALVTDREVGLSEPVLSLDCEDVVRSKTEPGTIVDAQWFDRFISAAVSEQRATVGDGKPAVTTELF